MKKRKNFTKQLQENSIIILITFSYIIKEDELYELFINFSFKNNDNEGVVNVFISSNIGFFRYS